MVVAQAIVVVHYVDGAVDVETDGEMSSCKIEVSLPCCSPGAGEGLVNPARSGEPIKLYEIEFRLSRVPGSPRVFPSIVIALCLQITPPSTEKPCTILAMKCL